MHEILRPSRQTGQAQARHPSTKTKGQSSSAPCGVLKQVHGHRQAHSHLLLHVLGVEALQQRWGGGKSQPVVLPRLRSPGKHPRVTLPRPPACLRASAPAPVLVPLPPFPPSPLTVTVEPASTEESQCEMPSWMMATPTSCQSRPCLLPSRPYWRYSTSRFCGTVKGRVDAVQGFC
jgi:hypothetical protein